MQRLRPEVRTFLAACEHLFTFTAVSGALTAEECRSLYYYAEELRKQIVPVCTDPEQPIPLEDKTIRPD